MIVLIMVVAWPLLRPDQVGPANGTATSTPAPTGAAAVDLSQMTPREAADRLFGRVMSAAEAGDSAQAAQFMPMAIQAYQRAQPLDLDGLFHLSTLQRTSLDLGTALETAQQGLATNEDHLLLLHAGGEAAREAGDTDLANEYFERILAVYDAQMASGNVDYQAHASMMTSIRQNAQAQLGG
jgi:tetratricopeptide (TPR) repeat protein